MQEKYWQRHGKMERNEEVRSGGKANKGNASIGYPAF
jgi:hypothetical protein